MTLHDYADCIDACDDCATACDRCAAACLEEPDVKAMSRCIALDIDCAAICRFAAGMMARASEFAMPACALCAELCEECGEECGRHPADHCQACAAACKRCAMACRAMSEQQ